VCPSRSACVATSHLQLSGRFGIRGSPQTVFSWAKRRISARTSGDVPRQYRRKPVRCQPTTVSGLAIANASRQRSHVLRETVQKSRSRGRSRGRGRFLLRTATCWRGAGTSTAISARVWNKTRTAPISDSTSASTDTFYHAATPRPTPRTGLDGWLQAAIEFWHPTALGPAEIPAEERPRRPAARLRAWG
jgi:hypothetical protein